AVTIVGLPLLLLLMFAWRKGADWERARVALFYGQTIARPYRQPVDDSWRARITTLVKDPATWRDLLYLALLFPIGLAEFVLVTVAITVPIRFIFLPVFDSLTDWSVFGPLWFIQTLPAALFGSLLGIILFPIALVL